MARSALGVPLATAQRSCLIRYGCAVAAVALAILVEVLMNITGPGATSVFLGAIMVATWFGGIGPGVVATALSSPAIGLLFVEPQWSLRFSPDDVPRFILFIVTALIIGWLHHLTQRSQQKLADANMARERFLAMLSHELRNPLSPVLAIAYAQEADATLPQEVRADAAMVRRNIEIEIRLIDDLLDANRLNAGKVQFEFQAVALAPLLEDVVNMCRASVEEKGIHLTAHPCVGEVHLLVDPVRLRQVLWNLLRNAAKFTPSGGRIWVECEQIEGRRVELRVRDTGIGIPADVLPRVFAPFEQSSQVDVRKAGGLGLGLAIARMIVEAHHGTIRASSEGEGRGATFSVILPLVDAPISTTGRGAVRPSPALDAGPVTAVPAQILLVEDHADTAAIMRRLLAKDGHTVHWVGSVTAAMEEIRTHTFDLLISDLGLPDGSGLDLMRQLRATGCRTPGIALSGYGQEQDRHESREAGFCIHLLKPVNPEQLRQTITEVMQGRPADSVAR